MVMLRLCCRQPRYIVEQLGITIFGNYPIELSPWAMQNHSS